MEQLRLENKLALLVFFRRLVGLVVFPADNLVTNATADVAHDVAAGGHVALARVGTLDVDDGVEEVCLTVLAAEVLNFVKTKKDGDQIVCFFLGGGSSSLFASSSSFCFDICILHIFLVAALFFPRYSLSLSAFSFEGQTYRLTRDRISSWSARWVLQFLQP